MKKNNDVVKDATQSKRIYGPPRVKKSDTEILADKIAELSAKLENYKRMYNENEKENKKLIQENEELKKKLEDVKTEVTSLKLQLACLPIKE